MPWDGGITIGIGVITGWVMAMFGDHGVELVVLVMVVTSVVTILASVFHTPWLLSRKFTRDMFRVPWSWVLIRIAGMVFGLIYLFQIGPDLLRSEEIGGAVFRDIAVNVLAVYVSACLLLPLLTEFGFMEFAGTLARPVFRRVFRLPGRAAIDATASFVGASSIGLLITIGQYERMHYTAREACVIAANFSIVSIPFALVVANVAGVGHLFIPWYGFVVLTCIAAAFITPRLPPLSRKRDEYIDGSCESDLVVKRQGVSLIREAWGAALERAAKSPTLPEFLSNGFQNLAFFLFSVVAAAMALATIALLVTYHTPIVSWLSYPFISVLDLAGLPDATKAAPGVIAGVLDQYIPAVVASDIESEVTSFVLAGLSICQLVFLSEVGVLILRSKLPLGLLELLGIFLLRTVIALPILVAGAHLLN